MTASVRLVFSGVAARRKLILENISVGGLFVRTSTPKAIGTKVSFEFHVRDGGQPITGTGVVRWIEKNPTKPPGMGIEFTMLNEEGRRELHQILQLEEESSKFR